MVWKDLESLIVKNILIWKLKKYSSDFLYNWNSIIVHTCSVVSDSVTPWTVAHQAPLSTGILQAKILKWVAISYSRGSSQSRNWTWVSYTGRQILYHWATGEASQLYWNSIIVHGNNDKITCLGPQLMILSLLGPQAQRGKS